MVLKYSQRCTDLNLVRSTCASRAQATQLDHEGPSFFTLGTSLIER